MKRYLGLIFLFVGMLNTYATEITSSLDITVPSLVDGVYPHKRRAAIIEQDFKIKNIEQDSIFLILKSCSIIAALRLWG
ncbi:MAG: hypothetical protein K6A36_06630 [Paludibacteraceae bacterium]|nr:hypothetical protein [Paludibacteraceae bacterium]